MLETQSPIVVQLENLGIEYRRYCTQNMSLKSAALNLFKGTQYQKFWVLKNLNLSIQKGEILGIVGRNGAGKSTLLRAIAGILPPTEGSVSFQGVLAPLMELGGGFNGELTGRENIFLNGAIMGLSKSHVERRVDSIVEFAELGDFIDSPISTYSTGMKARLAFAVGTDINPDILLVDEVFSVGDERFRRKAQDRVEKFFKAGKTIVLVSHNLELLKKYSTRMIYLEGGRIVASGEPEDVVKEYLRDN